MIQLLALRLSNLWSHNKQPCKKGSRLMLSMFHYSEGGLFNSPALYGHMFSQLSGKSGAVNWELRCMMLPV